MEDSLGIRIESCEPKIEKKASKASTNQTLGAFTSLKDTCQSGQSEKPVFPQSYE